MSGAKGKDKWQMVEEKQEELRRLTEEAWKKNEWELAALGERTLRTAEQSRKASGALKEAMKALNQELGRIPPDYGSCT